MFYASFSENFDGLKGEGRVHRVFEEIAEFQDRRGGERVGLTSRVRGGADLLHEVRPRFEHDRALDGLDVLEPKVH